ncbi:response regulator [Paenibacillus sp. 1001270B_150601_E10]|uniref:response regulator n=1 Tax=Paenibacillus sp. 1001270B_150601_E10 TaxID=2787079 RepID=UPI00189FC7FD|nr:response regulator [Paenibacillus sp. 1001270B_150601_E10]
MKVIIVDDERLAIKVMEKLLSEQTIVAGQLEVVGTFQNPAKALEAVQHETVDIAFLDIEMPLIDGFHLAEQLLQLKPHLQIVFVTAYKDHAIKAFELNALDYLLKPVNVKRLSVTLERILHYSSKDEGVAPSRHASIQPTLCCLQRMQYIDASGVVHEFQWRTLKAPELFAYLIYHRDKTVSKEALIDLLWSEYDTKKSTTQLYTAIYQIRKILKSSGLDLSIKYQDEGYRLVWGNVTLDVEEWERKASEALPVSEATLEEHLSIIEQYSGHFLEEHRYLWAEHEQERIRLMWLTQVKDVAQYYLSVGEYSKALSLYQQIREAAPYLEDGYFGVMRIYAEMNHPSEVVKHFELLERKCKEELDVAPSDDIITWYEEWRSQRLQQDAVTGIL